MRATNDVVWDWNQLNDLINWSSAISDRFGYKASQVDAHAAWWQDHIHPDDRSRVLDRIYSVINGPSELWTDEYRFRRSDGSYAEVLDRGYVVRDEHKRPIRMAGSMLDLTDRKRSEAALQASEARFRAAVSALSSLLWTNNAQGQMVGEQPGWGGFTGQSFDEYQGYGWANAVHPHDAQPTIDAWNAAVAARRMFVFEHRVAGGMGNGGFSPSGRSLCWTVRESFRNGWVFIQTSRRNGNLSKLWQKAKNASGNSRTT